MSSAFQNGGETAGIKLARGVFGGDDVFGGLDHRHAGGEVLGQSDFGAGFCPRVQRLRGKAVAEQRIVANPVEARPRQFQSAA